MFTVASNDLYSDVSRQWHSLFTDDVSSLQQLCFQLIDNLYGVVLRCLQFTKEHLHLTGDLRTLDSCLKCALQPFITFLIHSATFDSRPF